MKRLAIILLLLGTGCAHDLTAPLSTVPVTSMADYFWTGSPISFKDDTTGAITDQFSFQDSSVFLLANDADASGKLRTTIACTVSPDTVFAQNFVLGSVLDLDYGSYFSQLDNDTLTPHSLSAAIATDTAVFVATDSGVWEAPVTSQTIGSFRYDGIGTVSDIDALASSSDSIFAATRSGQIWIRNSKGYWSLITTAGQFTTPITGLTCSESELFALAGGSVSSCRLVNGGTLSWTPFTSLLGSKQISAIRAQYLSGTQYLILGATDGTVGGFPTGSPGSSFQHSLTATGPDTVYDFASNADKLLGAATENGIYQSDAAFNFPATPTTPTSSATTSLVFDPSNTLYYISNASVFSAAVSGSTISPPTAISKFYLGTPLKLLTESANSYLLTSSSFYQHSSTGWSSVPGFPRSYYPNLQGGLLLLKSNPIADSSWRAGTLVTSTHQSYPITARLLSRLDSLVIGGKSYSDVLVVRYSDESAGGVAEPQGVPYWVIYYQRGRGPIMFDRVSPGGALERRVVSN